MPEVADEIKDVGVAELMDEQVQQAAPEPSPTTETPHAENTEQGGEEGQSQEAVPTLKDRVAELGFKDVADDDDALNRLLEAHTLQASQHQQLQQQMENLRLQMLLAQQQTPQAQQAQLQQPAQPQGYWNPPKTNAALMQQFVAGQAEDGAIQWKPNTPPQVIAEHEAEQAYYRDHAQRLVRNWGEIESQLENRILDKAKELLRAEIDSHAQKVKAETFMDQQLRDHEDLLYQKDPITKAVRYDVQGNAVLSEAGVRLSQILGDLEQAGLKDEVARWNYAQQIYKAQYGDFRREADQQMQHNRLAHFNKINKPANHVPQRNGQDAGQQTNGRPGMQRLGERLFANHSFNIS